MKRLFALAAFAGLAGIAPADEQQFLAASNALVSCHRGDVTLAEAVERARGRHAAAYPADMLVNLPDYVIYVPRMPKGGYGKKPTPEQAAERGDSYNDHIQVLPDEKRKLLYAFWTQASWEANVDQHIAFSKSADGGRTWTEPVLLAGSECRAAPRLRASWQQPMLSKSGRIYCLWNQQTTSTPPACGSMFGVYSDDGGAIWEGLAEVRIPRMDQDPKDVRVPPCWCNWQRPLRLGEGGRYFVGCSHHGKAPYDAKSCCKIEFWQFENIDDDPKVSGIRFSQFATNRDMLSADKIEPIPGVKYFVPKEDPAIEEASIVKLPDGRLFALMRSSLGCPAWSQSRDGGRTWSGAKALLDPHGKPYPHPRSPCPLYDWKGCEAASGTYFALIHNEFDMTQTTAYQTRGPLYLIAGRFDPTADQPIVFGEPKLFMPRKSGNACYSSYTVQNGEGVLWFVDRKYYVLGRKIGPEWFEELRGQVTAGWEDVSPMRRETPYGDLLWRADLTKGGDFAVERREGAEGEVSFAGGKLTVTKTNGRGYILVRAPAWKIEKGRAVRFSADVSVPKTEPEFSHGFLRAYGAKENFSVLPDAKKVDSNGGCNAMYGLVGTAPGMTYRKMEHFRTDDGTVTPVIIVCGEPSVSVWSNWVAEDHASAQRVWDGIRKEREVNRVTGELMPEASFARLIAEDVQHTAKMVVRDGRTRFTIDGEADPPVAFHGIGPSAGLVHELSAKPLVGAGVRIVIPWFENAWTAKGFDAEKAVRQIRTFMRAEPRALYMIAFWCDTYPEFVDVEHPDEVWLADEEGKLPVYRVPGYVSTDVSKVAKGKYWRCPSMASRVWREAVKSNIRALVAELKRQGLDKRVIGIHTMGFYDGQFSMFHQDFSKHAKAAYREYRRQFPNRSDNYRYFCRQLGVMAQNEFAAEFKKQMGKDVVALRWYDSPFVVDFGLAETLLSPAIDIVVPQTAYASRAPAMADAPYTPYSSLNLHGKMLWSEYDHRTWCVLGSSSLAYHKHLCYAEDIVQWRTGYRKMAGEMIATGSGFWFYDMVGGWYASPELAADVSDSLGTMRALLAKKPSPWRPDTAIVIDEEGYLAGMNAKSVFPDFIYTISELQLRLLSTAGVPYEFYLADDVIAHPELLDGMKTVVFMLWRNIDAQRRDAIRRVAGAGKTLVFLAETGHLSGSRESTGFATAKDIPSGSYAVAAEPDFDIPTLGYQNIDWVRDWNSFAGVNPKVPVCSGRRSAVVEEPGVKVLARYADLPRAAIAERTDNGCRKVFIAPPGGFNPEFFRRLVRDGGGYAPVDRTGLVVNMNGDFVSVHALKAGRFQLRLPFPCRVTNVKSGKAESVGRDGLSLDVTAGETCWFLLER